MNQENTYRYDYFIASRFRNKPSVLALTQALRDQGKSVYCFLESQSSIDHCGDLENDPFESMKKFEAIKDWRNSPAVREIFETDMNALKASESVILLLPAGKSAHIEAGVSYGLQKPLTVIGEQKEAESLYLIFDAAYESIDDFIQSLNS